MSNTKSWTWVILCISSSGNDMLVFNSEMHLLTFVVTCLETGMLVFYQLPHWLADPDDRPRFWYLLLLVLLIVYNITGGLLPDKHFSLSIVWQNNICYGTGFLMAAYFPFFFYKCLRFERLRKHALLWSPLCILLPFVVFFLGYYSLTGDIEVPTSYGMIIPFLYSIWVLYAILNAIRIRFKEEKADSIPVTKVEALLLYAAVSPWVLMTVFSFLKVTQWLEVLCTNLGFLLTTVIFMSQSVKHDRYDKERLKRAGVIPDDKAFEAGLLLYGFTAREMDVVRLLREGLNRQEIGERLFISKKTAARHTQNIYYKAGVNSRQELIHKLETTPLSKVQ
ncbi:MAG TPA: helix-turn-helix transcriptional regulator [Mucilaginibacter sp.]|nr:helix-turn-helix transcriptional regulator [Mucilaginibacter sp.]